MKTDMKRILRNVLPLLLAAVLLWRCDFIRDGGMADRNRAETEKPRREGKETEDPMDGRPEEGPEILWISGVEYPEGYNWQRDTAYGRVDARLVLFRDGMRVLEIPAGERQEISTDPDMHRIFGGHLYTDYSSGTETVVRRDGKELFRFGGREMFVGFLVRGDIVWTLGGNRSTGKGLVLRRNVEPVFSDPDGLLPPGSGNTAFEGGMLHLDGTEMFFFYHSADGWFRVREQFAEPIVLPQGLTETYDIRRIGGKTVVAGRTTLTVLTVVQDGSMQACTVNGLSVRNVAIIPGRNGAFFLKGESVMGAGSTPMVWNPDGTQIIALSARVLDFYVEEGHAACITAGMDGLPAHYVKDGVSTPIDGRNHFISSRCGLLQNGAFYLLLTPVDRTGSPFLLRDGVREEIPLNGFLTGMKLIR